MTTVIWIEPQGTTYRTRIGGPEGDVLCERVTNPVVTSCRALMARGITGPFETWRKAFHRP